MDWNRGQPLSTKALGGEGGKRGDKYTYIYSSRARKTRVLTLSTGTSSTTGSGLPSDCLFSFLLRKRFLKYPERMHRMDLWALSEYLPSRMKLTSLSSSLQRAAPISRAKFWEAPIIAVRYWKIIIITYFETCKQLGERVAGEGGKGTLTGYG